MHHKKSMTQNAMVSMAILIFVGVISIVAILNYNELFLNKGESQACRSSIILSSASKSMADLDTIGSGESHFSMDCPRQELLIKKDQVVENGIFNQKKFHKIFADELANCWYMVGEGKLDPFSDWKNKDKTYCLICKTIVFDDSLREFMWSHAEDFDVAKLEASLGRARAEQKIKENRLKYLPTDPAFFLRSQYLSTSNGIKSNITYFEYLYNEKPDLTPSELQEFQDNSDHLIAEGTTILVRMSKLKTKSKMARIVIIGGIGLAVAAGITLIVMTGGTGAAVVPFIASGFGVAVPGIAATAVTTTAAVTAAALLVTQFAAPFVAVQVGKSTYEDCPDCQAVGGIAYIPPSLDYSTKLDIEFTQEDGHKMEKKMAICDMVVN